MRPVLICCALALACLPAVSLPVVALSATTTVSGTMPLIAYEVAASDITCSSAVISWKTNGPSTSQVFYDIMPHEDLADYANQVESDDLVSIHKLSLSGLSSGTSYYYAVKSVFMDNGSSLTAVEDNLFFATMAPGDALTIISLPNGKLPDGQVGVTYSQPLVASGGTPPYTWCIAAGYLPYGLSLDATTGVIFGTPTRAGMCKFTVRVTDGAGATATASVRIKIVAESHTCTTSLQDGEASVWGTLLRKAESLATTCVNAALLPLCDW